jgi:hypothetical protein
VHHQGQKVIHEGTANTVIHLFQNDHIGLYERLEGSRRILV